MSKEKITRTKFAVGHFLTNDPDDPASFAELAKRFAPRLREVYFPWPGLSNARAKKYDKPDDEERIAADLKYCREHGMKLDILANATCYAEKSFTEEQRLQVVGIIRHLDEMGLYPEIVTTTSPFIAKVFKINFPDIEVRASVNMRLRNTLALEYLAPLYDSYYICRDVQRDLPTMKMFADWGKKNGKKICMLANSGCLRYCPWQTFHETLLAHTFTHIHEEMIHIGMQPTLCATMALEEKYEEILRASWIRPEDLHRYEPYVSVFKLSTREADFPDLILKAYTSGSFDGNLLKILDPGFHFFIRTKIFDNKSFPKEWSEGKIAGRCAADCTHCGKCTEVLNLILKRDPNLPDYTRYTVAPPKKLKLPGC